MKLAYARIVTKDVGALVRFYRAITGVTPAIRNDDYVEFPTLGLTLAISSQRAMDLYGAGATTPASNRSAILDFQVDTVNRGTRTACAADVSGSRPWNALTGAGPRASANRRPRAHTGSAAAGSAGHLDQIRVGDDGAGDRRRETRHVFEIHRIRCGDRPVDGHRPSGSCEPDLTA
jgi:hypothetical protein